MQLKHLTPVLTVRDVAATMRFYQEVLGFQEWFRYPDETGALIAGAVHRDGARFIFDAAGDSLTPEQMAQRGTGVTFYIHVDGGTVDDLYAQVSPKAQVVSPPEDKPWGDRVFTITDPDGYRLSFYEEPKQ